MTSTNIYMGAPVRLTTLPNGAVTNAASAEKLAKSAYDAPVRHLVAPGVTALGGHGFLNLTLVEGPEGLVVFDTGERLEDGELFLREIRAISDKPIVAIIYSHSHYVFGTSVMIADKPDALIIGHPRVNVNITNGGSGNLYGETAPIQSARTMQQFNYYAPETGPNAPAGAKINFGRSGFVPVNTPVQDGQKMTVAGVEMQFFTRHGSDTDDCLTVYLPQTGVVMNNILWPFLPNIYTLRGAKFRDPREWRNALMVIRDLKPNAITGTHARSIVGAAACRQTLDDVIDGLNAILDQTLRGILLGLGPDDLRSFVRLPKHLQYVPCLAEIYGEISHFGPYLYNHALGWFDGDAATINPLPPLEQAERLVDAMGGRNAVLARAQAAFAAKEWAWAGQLVNYLFRINSADPAVRALKADVLEQHGRVTPGHTIRGWYIAQARALRGEVRIPRLQFANTRLLSLAEPAESLYQYRIRIDPQRSADMDWVVAISITDRAVRHGWHLRRGVVTFLPDPDADGRRPKLELATSYDNWLRFFSCKRDLADFLGDCLIPQGTLAEATAFFAAFDYYAAADNILI